MRQYLLPLAMRQAATTMTSGRPGPVNPYVLYNLQYAYSGGREYGTACCQGPNNVPYNPDFAAWARAAGVDGRTVTRSEDFADGLKTAVAADRPTVIDVHVDADICPPGTGSWELPRLVPKEPVFGKARRPGDTGWPREVNNNDFLL